DARAAAYLAGEALSADAENGWARVEWRGMPLGWGKVSQGTLKNHLPKGLRRTIH
ncbi:MAG: RNA methyltransferase, partial [Clostridia bacterium]|nr:RNA methyltransferase [Clostridia bacterium]